MSYEYTVRRFVLAHPGELEGVCTHRLSVEDAPECIHMGPGVYEPMESMVGCERGTRRFVVSVCRELERESLEVARACERALHESNWEVFLEPGDDERICSIKPGVPSYKGLDSNGRHVHEVGVEVVVDRINY